MRNRNLSFHFLYILFGLLFLAAAAILLVIVYSGAKQTIFLALLIYIAVVSVLALLLVWFLRRRIRTIINRLDDMVDQAIRNEDLELIYDESSLSALENKLQRFLVVSRNSSSQREQEKNKIKSIISDISHQTKTPISNIVLYAQLLQENEGTQTQSQPLIKEIIGQSEKLSFLIQALVKMSRLENGIINTEKQLSSVNELLVSSVQAIANTAASKNIRIELNCPDELFACFDCKWTEEAVNNLLDNAVKYTPSGGEIEVSARQYEMFTRIDIADSGIGIEEGEINHIFKRFYRSSHIHQYEGLGIGLYLVREIITMQGGYIKVQSAPGKGSVFSVFLPNNL